MPDSISGHRQRLRERFLSGEASALTDAAVLELLLTFAIPQKDVQPVALSLLQRFGSLRDVLAAPVDSLRQTPGIGDAAGILLKLVHEIGGRVVDTAEDESELPLGQGQMSLFGSASATEEADAPERRLESCDSGHEETLKRSKSTGIRPRPPQRRGTELFANALLKDAIEVLPRLPDTDSLEDVREYLRQEGLHYNSEHTRERYSQYIVLRMFPSAIADPALRLFARKLAGTQALRDVAFYRFMKAEPLIGRVVRELLLPAIGQGSLPRDYLHRYLAGQFPSAKVEFIDKCRKATMDALEAAGLCRVDGKQITFHLREPNLDSLAFILHSELPEPGIYALDKVETNLIFLAMLWRQDRVLPDIYELRNRGLISKVSEIDTVRQFTMRYDLEGLVKAMIGEGEPS